MSVIAWGLGHNMAGVMHSEWNLWTGYDLAGYKGFTTKGK